MADDSQELELRRRLRDATDPAEELSIRRELAQIAGPAPSAEPTTMGIPGLKLSPEFQADNALGDLVKAYTNRQAVHTQKQSGASLWDRLTGSFLTGQNSMTDIGTMLKERHPAQKIEPVVDESGAVTNQLIDGAPYDPQSPTRTVAPGETDPLTHLLTGGHVPSEVNFTDIVGDAADIARPALEAGAGIGAAALTGGAGAAPWLAVGADALATGGSSMALDKLAKASGYSTKPAEEMNTDALLAGGTALAADVGGNLIAGAHPTSAMAKRLGNETVTDTLANDAARPLPDVLSERQLMADDTGAALNPLEATGSRKLANWAGTIDESTPIAKIRAANAEMRNQTEEAMGKIADDIGKPGGAQAGKEALESRVKRLEDYRRKVTEPKWAALNKDFEGVTIPVENARKVAKEGTPLAAEIEAKGEFTLQEMQDQLEGLGSQIAKGDRKAALQFRSLLQDLEQAEKTFAAAGDEVSAEGAKMLREVRGDYAELSIEPNRISRRALTKRFKKALKTGTEGDLISGLSSTRNTNSLAETIKDIEQISPDAANSIRGDVVKDLFTKATKDGQLNFESLTGLLGKGNTRANLDVLFKGNDYAVKSLEALSDIAKLKGSGRAAVHKADMGGVEDVLSGMGMAATGAPVGKGQAVRGVLSTLNRVIDSEALPLFAPGRLQKILQDPKAAKKFYELVKKRGKGKWRKGVNFSSDVAELMALSAEEASPDDAPAMSIDGQDITPALGDFQDLLKKYQAGQSP